MLISFGIEFMIDDLKNEMSLNKLLHFAPWGLIIIYGTKKAKGEFRAGHCRYF